MDYEPLHRRTITQRYNDYVERIMDAGGTPISFEDFSDTIEELDLLMKYKENYYERIIDRIKRG